MIKLAGHPFEERDLLGRVMRNLRLNASRSARKPRWVAVRDTFAVGSTVSYALCKEFGLDPEELI